MDRDQARTEIRAQMGDYLLRKGINPRKPFLCLNPAHSDTHPSMSFDRKRNRVKCFSCGASYDVLDLIGMDYSLTNSADIFAKAREVFGIRIDATAGSETSSPSGQKQDKNGQATAATAPAQAQARNQEQDFTKYFAECKGRISDTDYHRGIPLEILDRHFIGYDPHFKTRDSAGNFTEWQALIIPTGRGSFQARNTNPNAGHKDRYRKCGPSQVFGYKVLQTADSPVFVVEGELDAMSIEAAGGYAVGLGSYDNVPLFLKMLEARKPEQPLIIAFDEETDQDKRERVDAAERKLIDGLNRLQIQAYRLHPYGVCHDANEAWTQDPAAFTDAITGAAHIEDQAEEEAREAYLQTSSAAHLQEFLNGIAASADTPSILTGFPLLDKALDTGLYEGLYAVGAVSSLGKTTLIMQMADRIAASGNDVLIFSLEMSRSQLMAKSISRHTLEIALKEGINTRLAKSSRDITSGARYINYTKEEQDLIRKAVLAYGEYANNIYIVQGARGVGVDQVRETIENHIRYTGKRPVAIIDYLQILAPYSERMTDKQNMDHSVLELKRISRDNKLPLIVISSFNRLSYNTKVSASSFKESGACEYTADVLIGLQFHGTGKDGYSETREKARNPRKIELVILKNREAATGAVISYDYHPQHNYFVETGIKTGEDE